MEKLIKPFKPVISPQRYEQGQAHLKKVFFRKHIDYDKDGDDTKQ